MKQHRIITILVCVVTLFFVLAPVVSAVDWLPLVPCGVKSDPTRSAECNQCELLHLLRNVIFAIQFGFVPIFGGLMFVYAGILYVLGAANPGLITKANNIFKESIYAIIIIGVAWLITNTVLVNLGSNITYNGRVDGKWYEFQCKTQVPAPAPTTPGGPPPPPPPGGVPGQAQAQAILAAGIGLSTNADCGAPNHAQGTISAIAGGKYPPVCSTTCKTTGCPAGGTSGSTTVDPAILDDILALKNAGFSFTVTSLTTGIHSSDGSTHYQGIAADIVVSGNAGTWQQVVRFLQSRGRRAFCETGNGKADSTCTVPPTDHIHWSK